jgi:RHS repeat-associated protein
LKLMPYGEEIQPPNVPNDRTKFATYHRDASGVDYADQRYYSPGSGRFMSSDPYLASGGASSPSSWNRFAYVEGDPVNLIDSRGLYVEAPTPFPDPLPPLPGPSGPVVDQPYDPTMCLYGPAPGCPEVPLEIQGQTTALFIHVKNASKTGPQQDRIRKVMTWISDNIDTECANWLGNAQETISNLLGDPANTDTVLIGHGDFDVSTVAAFYGNNPKQTDLPEGYAITVNRTGAFFNAEINVGGTMKAATVAGSLGGSNQAQVAILIHEIAHFLGAPGFKSDFGDPAAGRDNDNLLRQKCGRTIGAAGKMK